jgi:hypothetical protein
MSMSSSRRYRYALVVAIVGWLLAAPIIIAYESTVPGLYSAYIDKPVPISNSFRPDGMPDMYDWATASDQLPYITRLYEWDGPAWAFGIVLSIPLAWYFLLARIREVAGAIRKG